jgi:hypothetical protein
VRRHNALLTGNFIDLTKDDEEAVGGDRRYSRQFVTMASA